MSDMLYALTKPTPMQFMKVVLPFLLSALLAHVAHAGETSSTMCAQRTCSGSNATCEASTTDCNCICDTATNQCVPFESLLPNNDLGTPAPGPELCTPGHQLNGACPSIPLSEYACQLAPGNATSCSMRQCIGCTGVGFVCTAMDTNGCTAGGCCYQHVTCIMSFVLDVSQSPPPPPPPSATPSPSSIALEGLVGLASEASASYEPNGLLGVAPTPSEIPSSAAPSAINLVCMMSLVLLAIINVW